jgi:hypothetical protein
MKNNNDDENMAFLGFIIGLGLGICAMVVVAINVADGAEHRQKVKAVQAGVAHWNTATSGEVTFSFNTVTNK